MTMPARAVNIQELVTPKGITVWLVESHTIPMLSIEATFRAGTAFEPADKAGLANMTAALLDEGAGELDSVAFKQALDEDAIRLTAGTDLLNLSVNMDTLSEHKARAFELFGLAIRAPRVDTEALNRVKDGVMAGLRKSEENPGGVAQRRFGKVVFGEHPYGRQVAGDLASVKALTVADVKGYAAAQLTKANMVVSVVGDVTPAALLPLVDAALGDLPAGTTRNAVTVAPSPTVPTVVTVERKVPQSTILLGHLGLTRTHPDFWKMLVLNEIFGGGALVSRLGDVVREKHGLAYDVRSGHSPMPLAGSWGMSVQTDNKTAQKALDLMAAEVHRAQTTLPSEQEFSDVVDYLTGSFPLRLDSNAKILDYLSLMQMEGLGRDYLDTWVSKVRAVKREDLQQVAREHWHADALGLVIVGGPVGIKARWHPVKD